MVCNDVAAWADADVGEHWVEDMRVGAEAAASTRNVFAAVALDGADDARRKNLCMKRQWSDLQLC